MKFNWAEKTSPGLAAPGSCNATQYIAEELLRGEGFEEVRYRKEELERVEPALALVGCVEVFASERVRAISDLKGKTIVMNELGKTAYAFLASIC